MTQKPIKYLSSLVLLFFMMPSLASALQYSLLMTFTYKFENSSLSHINTELLEGEAPVRLYQPEDGYELRILSEGKELLYQTKFILPGPPAGAPPREWFDEKTGKQIYIPKPGEDTGIPKRESVTLDLIVPYLIKARAAEIYDNNNRKVLDIEIPSSDTLIGDLAQKEVYLIQDKLKTTPGDYAILASIVLLLFGILWLMYRFIHQRSRNASQVLPS